jgi:hypothetical protein
MTLHDLHSFFLSRMNLTNQYINQIVASKRREIKTEMLRLMSSGGNRKRFVSGGEEKINEK